MTLDHSLPQVRSQRGLLPKVRPQIPARRISFFVKFDLWVSTARSVDGLWVGSIEDKPWPGLSRVESALRLIRDRDPLSYSRVTRYLDRIWVRIVLGSLGEYQRQLNACVLDKHFVLSATTTVEKIASTIIHEVTHARLEHWGIAYDEKARSRIEAICVRRELSFVRKVPGGEMLREGLAASLNWYASEQGLFSDASLHESHVQGSIEALRQLGVPSWLIGSVLKLRGLRLALRGDVD
ncbi:hypothetical protein [Bradyrhizobium sp.]|uniref:hypothetical protein n=1 Tax=Bradyrhizobium sp. TaxID=376 RepID=UPI002D6CF8FD|nr:hypothetical protein [Bradyrhizobium sp.]HZR75248.1 hypothetical protein [Bradyrhizobium sp.]